MKKLILFCIVFFSLTACKDAIVDEVPAKNIAEALARLSAVRTWKIDKVVTDGVTQFENGIPLIPDAEGTAEYLEFDTEKKKISVKYPDEINLSVFDYVIDEAKNKFTVIEANPNDPSTPYTEVMTILAGSVYASSFKLESIYVENNKTFKSVVTLVPR
jgi:hypothetical protein